MSDTTIVVDDWATGVTLYTVIKSGVGPWDGTAFGPLVVANWAAYATATPETPGGSRQFVCQFPTGAPAGNYNWSVYLQAGGSPALGDVRIGGGSGYWDGTTFGGASSVTDDVSLPATPPTGYGGATVLHAGTAQAGAATSITLDSGAGSVDGQYLYCTIALLTGTGAGQSAVISAYDGTTKVATITHAWATNPDATTTFQVLPQGAVIVGQIAEGPRTVTQDYQGTGGFTVVSSATGLPTQEATVAAYLATAYAASGPAATPIASTTTDANGHWSLTLNPANYTLVFTVGTDSSTANITVN